MAEESQQPWWFRFMARHERPINFLLFGVGMLGIGSLTLLVWLVMIVAAAMIGYWRAFFILLPELLLLLYAPAIGFKWWRQERLESRPGRDARPSAADG